jgi:hypothetical protein
MAAKHVPQNQLQKANQNPGAGDQTYHGGQQRLE